MKPEERINGLALCAGVGGLELGVGLALGDRYRTLGFVERQAAAAAALVARMEDEALDRAPIWDDLASFDGPGFVRAVGRVDLVTAGFPCQPASVAGHGLGPQDDRWLWPDVERALRDVRPDYVFIENVPGLALPGRGGAEVFASLAALGFDAEWECLSARGVGAPHIRRRLYILAWRVSNAVGDGLRHEPERGRGPARPPDPGHPVARDMGSEDLADTDGDGARSTRISGRYRQTPEPNGGSRSSYAGRNPFPPGPDEVDAWRDVLADAPGLAPTQPRLRGMVDGLALPWVERLHAIGNGVVPLVAAVALCRLAARAGLAETLLPSDLSALVSRRR